MNIRNAAVLALTLVPLQLSEPPATASAPAACFDFEAASPISQPLRPPIPLKGRKDATASGTLQGKGVWGAARGVVNFPIQVVYKQLLDHYTIKDRSRVKLHVYEQEHSGYMAFHLVMVELKPAPMITLNWEEDWGYNLASGTPGDPKKIVISYQKTTGTSFIPHLCGSIVLEARPDGATDIALYEEIEATGKRSSEDTAKGHLGTLATLRKIASTK